MLSYIKKFLLDSFPSIIATIIGAYIVHHYVIPAAAPKPVVNATISEPAVPAAAVATTPVKASFEKGVAEKSAIEKTAEKASDKSAEVPLENKRRHTAPRVANRAASPEATGSSENPQAEERRDANELARAAIERQRNASAASRTVALAPAPAHSSDDVLRAASSLPPLPQAIPTAKGPDVFNAGADATMESPAQHPEFARSAKASRLTPPAEIPDAPPIELHADAQTAGKPSIAEGVVSAAKSVFHAVVPR